MLARINTIALEGITARHVEVEVDLGRGLPSLNLVGLPEAAVRESKDRVRSALNNTGYTLPNRRVTINLAPANLSKEGSAYDLPIALGLLTAMGKLPEEKLASRLFLGELALDGRLKAVPGALPAALHARENRQTKEVIVPSANGPEAALVPNVHVVAPGHLQELIRHLLADQPNDLLASIPATSWRHHMNTLPSPDLAPDLADIKGQEHAKRALEIVAAGGHNLLMSGPPGSGKTLIARCLPGLLPPLSLDETLEITAIYSVAGKLTNGGVINRRPFRTPHHTASHVALVGGGSIPKPGEVSLAHQGVLFLDELPEFGRRTLEALREPLEASHVTVSRAARTATFPASFQLVAACNPCPCGHHGDPFHACRCSRQKISHYRARLSGPLLDRIDLHVEVPPVPHEKLLSLPHGESSEQVRKRIVSARDRQFKRNGEGRTNAHLEGAALERHTTLSTTCRKLLLDASRSLGFSARAYHRILKVARSAADLEEAEHIDAAHLSEAIQYRTGGTFL